jgi:hypothetical protein
MNTRRFVSGSSVILAGWLGATFLNEVPSQRYPKLDKKPATAATTVSPEKLAVASVSGSR